MAQGAANTRGYADLITPEGLKQVATYANAIGPFKTLVVPVKDGVPGEPTPLVAQAHAAGLAVHIWTLRPENAFLPAGLKKAPTTDGTVRAATAWPRSRPTCVRASTASPTTGGRPCSRWRRQAGPNRQTGRRAGAPSPRWLPHLVPRITLALGGHHFTIVLIAARHDRPALPACRALNLPPAGPWRGGLAGCGAISWQVSTAAPLPHAPVPAAHLEP